MECWQLLAIKGLQFNKKTTVMKDTRTSDADHV